MSRVIVMTLLGVCVGLSGHRPLAAQEQEWSISMSSASGRYFFDQPTVTHVVTVGGGLSGERWRIGALWPLVIQNSSVVTFIGGTPLPTGGPGGGTLGDRQSGERIPMRRRQSAVGLNEGLATAADSAPLAPGPYVATVGDPIVSVGRDLVAGTGTPHRLSATAYVKLPVAPVSSGVGSGAVDLGASLSYGRAGTRGFIFADVGYWHLGDLADQPLRDIATGALGAGRMMGPSARWTIATVLSASSAVVETVDPPVSISVTLGRSGTGGGTLTTGAAFGLSESSADWTLSVGWRIATDWRPLPR